MARTKKKAPPRAGKKATKAKPRRVSAEAIFRKAAKEKRPTRFRYDSDGNVIGFYVPLQHQTKAQQRKATKAMVSACSAGAYRQGVSPTKTCGYRGLKPSHEAGRGLAYARWGFPKGWPKGKFKNPAYMVRGMTVKTFKDEDGDWGYAVYGPMGEPLAIGTGEASEKLAAREGKAEGKFQAEILEAEGRSMRNPKKATKSGWALVKSSGMDDKVLSTHKTKEAAQKAMRKRGGEPDSMFTSGMRVVEVGPGSGSEVIQLFGGKTTRSTSNPKKVTKKVSRKKNPSMRSIMSKALK